MREREKVRSFFCFFGPATERHTVDKSRFEIRNHREKRTMRSSSFSFLLWIVTAWGLHLEIDDRTGGFELYEDETKTESYFASPKNWGLSVNGVSNLTFERNGTHFIWYDESGRDVMKTSYIQESNDMIVFETCFLQDLNETQTSSNITESKETTLSNFPSFDVMSSSNKLGFFGYYNQMLGGMFDGTKFGVWGETDDVPVGTMGGPIVSFGQKGVKSILLGPYENVMTLNAVYDKKEKVLSYGLLGSFTSIPKGTCASITAVTADTPSDSVKRYGSALLSLHGKESVWNRPSSDPTIHYLTYSTDNGAYYYYNSAPFADEQTAVESVLLSNKLPYGGVLLDSWWYPKDRKGGTCVTSQSITTLNETLLHRRDKLDGNKQNVSEGS